MKRSTRYDRWSSLVLFLLGASICYGSVNLGLGTWSAPGSGFLPFGAGLGLSLFSVGIFALPGTKRESAPSVTEKFWPRPESGKVVSLVLLSLIVYDLIWTRLGFSLTTFLFLVFLFRVIGKRKWWITIMGAAVISGIAYVLFQIFLECRLPTGFVGF